MRAIAVILLAAAGCGSDLAVSDLGTNDIGAAAPDLAMCTQGVGPAPTVTTPCGPLVCAPGQICVAHQPGAVVPDMAQPDGGAPDGGGFDAYDHSCIVLPPQCQLCGGCGDGTLGVGRQFGCFTSICLTGQGEMGCRFDGATLTCIGL